MNTDKTTIEYDITREQCLKMINGVCSRCGGELEPIETVNNSNFPTFWVGCRSCGIFDNGTSRLVFEIAREMVIKKILIPYSHLESTSIDVEYYIKCQTDGARHIVQAILDSYWAREKDNRKGVIKMKTLLVILIVLCVTTVAFAKTTIKCGNMDFVYEDNGEQHSVIHSGNVDFEY